MLMMWCMSERDTVADSGQVDAQCHAAILKSSPACQLPNYDSQLPYVLASFQEQ